MKILPPHLAVQPGFSERFSREARALAKLHHPNIVTVFDFGESGGFFYLLMEFVNGVNLRKAMQAGVKPEQAMLLVPRICEALQFAHDHGVLHRDIKPENILLDTAGTPKLADFGIAKLADEKGSGLTLSGAALGTASYMAPEQIEKPATVDHRADIYSLGVVFYEMLTGELPLGRFGVPSEKANVSEGVDAVVMRALEKERERRQQSAGEMKTQVEHATPGGCQLTVRPAERPEQDTEDQPAGGIQHFLGVLTALAGIGIPASAVMPWMRSLGLTPAVMVFVCAGLGVLSGMWPGGRKRRRPASPAASRLDADVICPRRLFGYPLWHIASSNAPDPVTGRHRIARGIIAIGPEARGFLAIGGRAHGVIALGGMATGVVACGGIAGGLVTGGGLSLGLIAAAGGLAAGGLARGGIAVGYDAEGALAAGHIARGGQTYSDAPGPPNAMSLHAVHYLELALQGLGVVCFAAVLAILVGLLFASRHEPAHVAKRRRWNVIIAVVLMFACVPVWREFRRRSGEKQAMGGTGSYQSTPAVRWVDAKIPPFSTSWDFGSAELVAVSQHPSISGRWWRMDGMDGAEGPFLSPATGVTPSRGERACEFIFHLRDIPAGSSPVAWLIEHASASAGGDAPSLLEKPGTPLPGYLAIAAALPDSRDRTNIKLGLASGNWRTMASGEPNSIAGTSVHHDGVQWEITRGTAVETKDGSLAITFTSTRHADWQDRVIAVNAADEEITTKNSSQVGAQTEWIFPGLTLTAVKEFRFQVRRMDWIEFRGIALAPAN